MRLLRRSLELAGGLAVGATITGVGARTFKGSRPAWSSRPYGSAPEAPSRRRLSGFRFLPAVVDHLNGDVLVSLRPDDGDSRESTS